MTNILDDIATNDTRMLDDLHYEICLAVHEEAGTDDAKRQRVQADIVEAIAKALLGTCGEPLQYDPLFVADYRTGLPGP